MFNLLKFVKNDIVEGERSFKGPSKGGDGGRMMEAVQCTDQLAGRWGGVREGAGHATTESLGRTETDGSKREGGRKLSTGEDCVRS